MLYKKLSYIVAALLLLMSLIAYMYLNSSSLADNILPSVILVLLLAVPLIITLAIGHMYDTPRLPKDMSWLCLAFLGGWAFVCSNIVILASRQSTMQYGTILTILDFFGFDVSHNYNDAVRLEALAILLISTTTAILLVFMPMYAYS